MQQLFENFKLNIPKSKITNERQSIIKEFVDEINKERINTKYKLVSGSSIAIKLSVLKTKQELHEFLSECRDYKNRNGSFSKRFFGGFKEKKVDFNKKIDSYFK